MPTLETKKKERYKGLTYPRVPFEEQRVQVSVYVKRKFYKEFQSKIDEQAKAYR